MINEKRICGPVFPGVEYAPMKSEELKKFVIDIQTKGFTPWRKMRLLQAVGRFCTAAAVPYLKAYNAVFCEFTGAAWLAINGAINHYSKDMEGGFLTLLAFWIRSEYNKVIYRNYVNKRYSGDKAKISFESIYKPLSGEPGDGPLIIDTIKDETSLKEFERTENGLLLDRIKKDCRLSKDERDILGAYYGLLDDEGGGLNLSELAAKKGCSRENIRQIKKRALKKIQDKVKKDGKK